MPDESRARPCGPLYPRRPGRPSIRSRTRRPAPNQKGGSDMTSREKELSALPQTSDPPRGRLAELMGRLIYPFLRGEPPKPQPAPGFYTDTTVCIGCKACEVACKQWNQIPADGFKWTGNSYDNTGELSALSWRHVKFIEQFTRDEPDATPVSLPILPGCGSNG